MDVQIFDFSDCQDLALIEVGRQQCSPLYSFGPFMRNDYIFHYVVSGKGYYTVLDSPAPSSEPQKINQEVNAGEGFLLEPHTKHIYYADKDNPWQYIWVVFRGLSAPRYLKSCGLNRQSSHYFPKDCSSQVIQKIKRNLLSILNEPEPSRPFIMGHFHLFFSELQANSATPCSITAERETSLSVFYISQAIRYISHNYAQIQSLEDIANACGISRSHLSRLFREHMHISLQEHFIQYRLSKAADLLINTNLPIIEIAYKIGYENELNLLRSFKSRYGMTPNAYRKKSRS
jgi:AraC-like DNA-binding protein